jgi:protoheme IX farnesyltransferase
MKVLTVFGDLIKYKLSLAVVISSVTGYMLSGIFNVADLLFMASGVFFLASSSAVLNQYAERETDKLMERTSKRPIPAGRISGKTALMLFVFLFISGIYFLAHNGINPVLTGILTMVLYNIVYTRMKRITIFSIIPGSIVGALPPVIGYVSSKTDIISPSIISFSVMMFLWQIPHFWLLLVRYGKEYDQAGLATISVFLTDKQLKAVVFIWVLLSNATLLVFFFVTQLFGYTFALLYLFLNFIFIPFFYVSLFRNSGKERLKGSIMLINSYNMLIMLLLIVLSVF